MSDLVKELQQKKQKDITGYGDISFLNSVNTLLLEESREDKDIAKWLGKHHSISIASDINDRRIELESLEGKFGDNIFLTQHIKSLCKKYNLRFLRTAFYKGHMEVECIAKIKAFAKEKGIELNQANVENNYFVLAPQELFQLEQQKAERIVRLPRATVDPVLFYKIDKDHYKMLHKWGKDFTIARLWKGLMWRNLATRFLITFGMAFLGIMAGMLLVSTSLGAWYILSVVAALIVARIYNNKFFNAKDPSEFFSEKNWSSSTLSV